MAKSRKTYSREFKMEAVRLLETSGKSAMQLEGELGMGQGILLRWKEQLAAGGEDAFPGHGRRPPGQERLRHLERENEIQRQEREILKKAGAVLTGPKAARFACIDEHRHEFPVTRLCKALKVSTSGYYAWRQRRASARERADRERVPRSEAADTDR